MRTRLIEYQFPYSALSVKVHLLKVQLNYVMSVGDCKFGGIRLSGLAGQFVLSDVEAINAMNVNAKFQHFFLKCKQESIKISHLDTLIKYNGPSDNRNLE